MSDILLSSLVQMSKASACGLGVHAGSSLASSILSGKILRNVSECNPVTANCLKFAALLGGFSGVYRMLRDTLERYQADHLGSGNVLAAAATASLAFLLQPNGRRQVISLFLASRALSALVKRFEATGMRIPKAAFLLGIIFNTAVLVQSGLVFPDTLPPSYYKSLLRWSCRFNDTNLRQLYRPCPEMSERMTCHEAIHPGRTCSEANLLSFLAAFWQSVKVYGVLCSVPLVFRYKQLLARPIPVLAQTLKTTLRSGLYLSLTCLLGYMTTCTASRSESCRQYIGTPNGRLPSSYSLLMGLCTGLAAMIEPSSRWYELTMYTTPIAANVLFRHLQRNNIIPATNNFSIVFIATSMMVIMQAYEHHRTAIPPWLVSILAYLVQ